MPQVMYNWNCELLLFVLNHSFLAGRWSINIEATRHDDKSKKIENCVSGHWLSTVKKSYMSLFIVISILEKSRCLRKIMKNNKIFSKFLYSENNSNINSAFEEYCFFTSETAWDNLFITNDSYILMEEIWELFP
jgi:hypothetical protein